MPIENIDTIIDFIVVPTPTNLSVTNITPTSATLTWDAVPEAEEYIITQELQTITGILTNSFQLTGLTPGTVYSYTVRAKTGTVLSGYSNPINVETPLVSEDPDPVDPDPGEPVDYLGSFIFMTEYTVPAGTTGDCTLKYRVGKMSDGLDGVVITRTVSKEVLINNFGLDPTFSGTRVFNPREYGL